MARKKKLGRKELLKKPDEFITFSNRVYLWIRTHARYVVGVVSALVLFFALFLGYSAYQNRQERQAREGYYSALEKVDPAGQLSKLEEVIQKYPRTRTANLARIAAGHLYFQKKDYARAVTYYQSVLDKGKIPPDIRSLLLENLAYAQEQKGDLSQAASTFSRLSQGEDETIKEEALLHLARVYQKMGKTQEAKAAYQTFISRYPKSPFTPIVKDKLAEM